MAQSEKWLLCKREGPCQQHPHEKWSAVAHVCHTRAGEAEAGGF